MAIFVPLTEERVRRAAPFVGIPKGGTPFGRKRAPQDEPFHFGMARLKILFNIIFNVTFVILLFT